MDLVEVVREVVEFSRARAAQVCRELELVAEEGPVVGRWGRERLAQVAENLLSNALKYGVGHPVWVKVEAERTVLEVRDERIGIEPEHLERIFGKFERTVSGWNYGELGLELYLPHAAERAGAGQRHPGGDPAAAGRHSAWSCRADPR